MKFGMVEMEGFEHARKKKKKKKNWLNCLVSMKFGIVKMVGQYSAWVLSGVYKKKIHREMSRIQP